MSCSDNQGSANDDQSTGELSELQKLTAEVASSPSNAEALYNRAEYHYNHENYADAVFDLAAAMKLDSINEKYHLLLADAYLGSLKSEYALLTMERAVRLFPESTETLVKAAELQIILRRYEDASRTLAKAIQLDPTNVKVYFLLGVMFQEQGNTERAIQSFQRVVEMDSENKEAWTMLGNLYDIAGNDLAMQCFDNAINIDSSYSPAWHSKAFYLQNHGNIDAAIEIYRRIHKIDPEYGDAYLNAGILLLEKDNLETAEQEFLELRELAPTNALVPFYLGVIYERKLDFQTALGYYNQATALSPRNTRFAEAAERMEIATQQQ